MKNAGSLLVYLEVWRSKRTGNFCAHVCFSEVLFLQLFCANDLLLWKRITSHHTHSIHRSCIEEYLYLIWGIVYSKFLDSANVFTFLRCTLQVSRLPQICYTKASYGFDIVIRLHIVKARSLTAAQRDVFSLVFYTLVGSRMPTHVWNLGILIYNCLRTQSVNKWDSVITLKLLPKKYGLYYV